MEITRNNLTQKINQLKAAGFIPTEIALTRYDSFEVLHFGKSVEEETRYPHVFELEGIPITSSQDVLESTINVSLH